FSTDQYDATSVVVFPNPVNDIIQIKGTSIQKARITIYDIRGRKQANFKRLGPNKIDVSKLASGFYFLKLNELVYKVFKN
ncbi:T9SS type A sorting domain-containing protein, partial [bacterium]|nr:T9SS type A sorting domain-containing protein [bacterium]